MVCHHPLASVYGAIRSDLQWLATDASVGSARMSDTASKRAIFLPTTCRGRGWGTQGVMIHGMSGAPAVPANQSRFSYSDSCHTAPIGMKLDRLTELRSVASVNLPPFLVRRRKPCSVLTSTKSPEWILSVTNTRML